MIILDILSWIFLIGGSFFSVVGGIGIVRLPEFFSRLHGGGITDTLGSCPDRDRAVFSSKSSVGDCQARDDSVFPVFDQSRFVPRAGPIGLVTGNQTRTRNQLDRNQ